MECKMIIYEDCVEELLYIDTTTYWKELKIHVNLKTNKLTYLVKNGRAGDDIYGEYDTYQEAKEVFDDLFNDIT